jgi:rhomboid protease GluP
VLAIVASIFLPLAFAKKYLNYRKFEHFIILSNESLTIPTPMMKDRKIDLSRIKSLETLHYFNKTKGLLIGLLDGSSEFIDADSFESAVSFDEFKQKLIGYTTQGSTSTSNKNTKTLTIERIKNNHKTTTLIVIAIFIIYIITAAPGLGEISKNAIEIGALTKSALKFQDLYRLTSTFFLHLNFNHLLINLLCLAVVGNNINILLGRLRFSGLLFGSALFGSLLSVRYSEAKYVIGASGGIMGLLGAYTVICLKYQHAIPGSVSTSAKKIIFILFLQMASDITAKGVDVFSHLGGGLFGAMYVILFLNQSQQKRIAARSTLEAIIAIASGSLYVLGGSYFIITYFFASFKMP